MAPRKPSGSVPDHGDWAVPYQPADIADLDPATADRRGGIPKPPMLDAVYRVVETEGPIHRQVLLRHLGELLHKTRPSSISPSVNAAADQLRDEGRIAEAGDFLDVAGRPCTEARWPLPGLSQRPVEHVAPAERQRALLGLVADRPRGLGAEEAVGEALAFFGWTARNAAARARLMADLYRLRDTGALTGWPDKLEPAG
ncbi:hypothetical protein KBZ00_21330 [Streptomyces sp. RK31]|uniref:DUF3320 domain-containing protein n=1 Tax=Streptomyces tunisiensis TaxID=948699 RepID=A0ABP7YSA1_9ACTN|nr:hypothetical protein [Streptomyces sp. RK31]MBQ0973655.1 hypothetical protein [Streptomyces sp. RK31]